MSKLVGIIVGVVALGLVVVVALAVNDSSEPSTRVRSEGDGPAEREQADCAASEGQAGEVSSGSDGSETSSDATSYWSEERMDGAKPAGPMESDEGGPVCESDTTTSTGVTSPGLSGSGAGGATTDEPISSGPDEAQDHDGWTQEEMDNARPPSMEVPSEPNSESPPTTARRGPTSPGSPPG